MAFELMFAPGFFFNEGEPYDGGPEPCAEPTSVWHAITSMPEDEWTSMCVDCFPGVDPSHVTPESVLDMVRETNTCTDLRPPVAVWIDPQGYHTLSVHERGEA